MNEVSSQTNSENWHYDAFQSLCLSAFQRISVELDSSHAIVQLIHARLVAGNADPSVVHAGSLGLAELLGVDIEAALKLKQEWLRNSLVVSMTIFDTFLTDLTRFLFLHQPMALPKDKQCSFGEILEAQGYEALIDQIIRKVVNELSYKNYRDRVAYLKKAFGFSLTNLESSLNELGRFAELRNQVVHDSALWKYSWDGRGKGLRIEPKPLPNVSFEAATEASLTVIEVIDGIFVEASRKLFKRDPKVRLTTPETKKLHESIRKQLKERHQ